MSTITISDSVDAIMRELSYQDPRQALKDSLTTEILARISSYKSEVMHFNERYGKPFEEIAKECRSKFRPVAGTGAMGYFPGSLA